MQARRRASYAAAPQPSRQAAGAEQVEATDAATQVTFKFPTPGERRQRPHAVDPDDRPPGAGRSGWRSIRPTPTRAQSAGRGAAHQRRRHRPAAGHPDDLRARQGRQRLLCRRCAPVGLPDRRDAAAGLCARREDHDRARSRADRSGWRPARSPTACCATVACVRQTTTYRVHGPAKEPRQLIIMQRRLPGWTLAKPDAKGIEISEGNYRMPFQLPGRRRRRRSSRSRRSRPSSRSCGCSTAAATRSGVFAQATEFDAKTREALTKVLQLQQAVAEAQRKLTQVDTEQQQIVQEQAPPARQPRAACRPTATCSGAISRRSTSRRTTSTRWRRRRPMRRRRSTRPARRCALRHPAGQSLPFHR